MNPGAEIPAIAIASLGWDRFVAPINNERLLTMVTYHGLKRFLVLALLTL